MLSDSSYEDRNNRRNSCGESTDRSRGKEKHMVERNDFTRFYNGKLIGQGETIKRTLNMWGQYKGVIKIEGQ